MRLVCSLVAALALAVPCAAQERSARDAVLESLVAAARGAPPEFEADALLRIAQSSKVDDDWRRELLTDAFLRAYGAQESYRRIAFQVPRESRQGAEALADDSRLTRLSLQVRAIQLLSMVDPGRARELFEWIDTGVE